MRGCRGFLRLRSIMDKTGEAPASAASIATAIVQAESTIESKAEPNTESKRETEAKEEASSTTESAAKDKEIEGLLLFLEDGVPPGAMRLFELWVGTGKLGPMIRHRSNSTVGYYVYIILYVLAYGLADETLCNLLIDELIGFYGEA